ncbi:Maf family protein [Inhella gelatinilytica]|uniref:dTTP/UTP pyrophosphatase n=1 Tax=Inhella gelatinilytica TaxID=2795030 RepID=A0A931IXM0_9BURK|nr:Maf family protein [Inhella gelatinilytica]MBH9554049.1 septum formation inhibitor Maf [Inhella gelatinilytica]
MKSSLFLASQSPRRSQLLTQLGVAHELLLPGPEEDAEALETQLAGEGPDAYVARVTTNKLWAALERRQQRDLPERPVLCSDTTVALGNDILGKPADDADALMMLQRLSGQTHRVLTAVSLAWWEADTRREAQLVSVSTVRFARVPDAVLHRYVATGEPQGKAGAYAIQSQIAGWIERIEGSYSGIMGLPLFETAQLLRQAGWDL